MDNTKPKFRTIAILSAFITSIVACTVDSIPKTTTFDSSGTEAANIEESPNTTIVSQDQVLQLTMPQTWKDAWTEAEQERWTLLIQHPSGQAQIGVHSWSKAENPEMSLNLISDIALQAGVAPFADAEILKEAEPTNVNGYTAVQHQVRGTLSGYRLVAVSTVVETPHYYHMVFTLVPEQDFEQKWNEAHQIIQSLQEIQSTAWIAPNVSSRIHTGSFFGMAFPK